MGSYGHRAYHGGGESAGGNSYTCKFEVEGVQVQFEIITGF